ncbi:hypothetical protein J4727_12170, partial [Providencia rettgeri]|nr:hypothetical protein [Providencia rettgeri]
MLTMEGLLAMPSITKLPHQGVCSFCLEGLPKMPTCCCCVTPCEQPTMERGRCKTLLHGRELS